MPCCRASATSRDSPRCTIRSPRRSSPQPAPSCLRSRMLRRSIPRFTRRSRRRRTSTRSRTSGTPSGDTVATGFHGLSVAWSTERASALLGRPELGLVIAHLGAGCSVSAVWQGRSVGTSMGMTPLDGVVMATRAGAVDPGILLAAQRDHWAQNARSRGRARAPLGSPRAVRPHRRHARAPRSGCD